MSSFTAPLEVRYNHTNDTWMVLRDFEFHCGSYPSDKVIKVRIGEITDFASIPWWARWLLPKSGKYNQATVVHDKMCRDFYKKKCQPFYSTHKQRCDIFLEALVVLNVPKWKRWLMFQAVKIGGPRDNGDNY